MSAHHLTIAKASFAAALLRPDITKVVRDNLSTFHNLIEAAIATCTARNVQKCTEWIVTNIAPSAARSTALGKYLSSYSRHKPQDPLNDANGTSASASRKKLHILYIVHDVVHHTKYHVSSLSAFSTFTASIQPFLVDLVLSTVSEPRARISFRLLSLFEVWESEEFYSKDYVNKLRQAITEPSTHEHGRVDKITSTVESQTQKSECAFIMPSSHGDLSTPFYDLPAGNLLPFLDPDSSAPINPEQIRPLQFIAGPADKPLVNALKDFLKDVKSIEDKNQSSELDLDFADIDELGQITIRDETGEITGDTYYGWSRAFCEKMKRRGKGQDGGQNRHKAFSRESSRSSSRSPRKRRRYSDSSRSRSPSHSRSKSPPRFRAASPPKTSNEPIRDPLRLFTNASQSIPPPSMPANLLSNSTRFHTPPLGPNGLPIPPPRPPNWIGPWPPPPPPNAAIGNVPFPPPHMKRGNNFPPPPPLPPPGYPGTYNQNYR